MGYFWSRDQIAAGSPDIHEPRWASWTLHSCPSARSDQSTPRKNFDFGKEATRADAFAPCKLVTEPLPAPPYPNLVPRWARP